MPNLKFETEGPLAIISLDESTETVRFFWKGKRIDLDARGSEVHTTVLDASGVGLPLKPRPADAFVANHPNN